jgi:hypothetical protein
VSHSPELLFANDFVVVADSADGVMPLLSDPLLNLLQAGRWMELRFRLKWHVGKRRLSTALQWLICRQARAVPRLLPCGGAPE